ncbi:hypothetical protein EKO04_005154 [Ascochyta lentis]|uniref:Transcription factor domain-containing protein n=1 Tax=Ascochyta lentis TaxID=205686 RepID=A0A8H7J6F0_9PLEO|nr:hypothetical protein EKO04_005154 [Ascochyta lentis]
MIQPATTAARKRYAAIANDHVNNLSELDERLGSMENALRQLTEIVKEDRRAKQSNDMFSIGMRGRKRAKDRSESGVATPILDADLYEKVALQQKDAEMADGIDAKFKGCSMVSLCEEIEETIEEFQLQEGLGDASPSRDGNCIKALLTELYDWVDPHGYMDSIDDGVPVCLPPRQLLSMASVQFFQSLDVATDIFCKQKFWESVERIYGRPFTATDTAWAVCFDLIIILGIGVDQSDSSSDDFLKPFLLNVSRGYASTSIWFRPELVNVQALALLSLVAQQHFHHRLPGLVFDQACMLFKQLNFSDGSLASENESYGERDEKTKVWTSLFIRDKCLSVSRGKSCCLPAFDWSPLNYSIPDSQTSALLELAKNQEEIYNRLYSKESSLQTPSRRAASMASLIRDLGKWADVNSALLSEDSLSTADIQLKFRSTRVLLLRLSTLQKHKEEVLNDTRVASFIVTRPEVGDGTSSRVAPHR